MIQKNYKDKLFALLFGKEENKKNLLSLYNALNDTNYSNTDDLEITTIEDAIYLGYKNDVSVICGADNTMSLYEQQSTLNPNMPLRGVIYFADLFEKYVKANKKNIYGSKKIDLPTPKYFVFYIGRQEVEDRIVYKLSDMYDGDGDIECTATMLNINIGHNKELLDKCKTLYGYSFFVKQVYDNFKACGNIELAVDEAVKECIEGNILRDILQAHRAEVKDMLLTEFDQEEYIELERKDAFDEGKAEGKAEGIAEGIAEGEAKSIMSLLNKGVITKEQAAEELGITEKELEELINK